MKVWYYIALTVCLLQFGLYLLFPFGGLVTILRIIREGLYGEKYITELFENQQVIFVFLKVNRVVAMLYFGSIFLCSMLPLFFRINKTLKYKIGIGCFITSMAIIFVPKILGLIF